MAEETRKPGVYDAKVADYGIGKTKTGKPMAMIRFAYQDAENQTQQINWYGTFSSDKAAEISSEALAVCGMSSNNPADLAKGQGSGILDETRTISITLKNDTWEGTTRLKVAYVNPPGGGGFRDTLEHGDAVQAFSGLNLGGIMASARQKHTKTIVNHAPGANGAPAPEFNENEEIPF